MIVGPVWVGGDLINEKPSTEGVEPFQSVVVNQFTSLFPSTSSNSTFVVVLLFASIHCLDHVRTISIREAHIQDIPDDRIMSVGYDLRIKEDLHEWVCKPNSHGINEDITRSNNERVEADFDRGQSLPDKSKLWISVWLQRVAILNLDEC